MWTEFAVAVAMVVAMLYAPGALLAVSLGVRPLRAVCVAPVLSTLVYVLLANAYVVLGASASGLTLLVPALLLGVLAAGVGWALRARRSRLGAHVGDGAKADRRERDIEPVALVPYLGFGLAVTAVVFVRCLDGPESYMQMYDNIFHLGLVRNFVESGSFSFFDATLYSVSDLSFVPPSDLGSPFYPAAWHCLSAMAATAANVSVPLACNALNTVLIGVVFPLSTCALVDGLFQGRRRVVVCGSLCALAFGVFPWGFVVFGPLYPNLMSYALLPAVLLAFVSAFEDGRRPGERVRDGAFFVAGIVAVAAAQPNAVFTAAVFLAPFVVWQASRIADLPLLRGSHPRAWRMGLSLVAVVLIAAVWRFCYGLGALQAVVTYEWPATSTLAQAVVNVLTLGLVERTAAQPVLAAMVLVGIARALSTRRLRWLAGSYGFAALIYCVSTTTDGSLKHLLAGFWYTDSYRLAATIGLFAIPLAALGLEAVWVWISTRALRGVEREKGARGLTLRRAGLFGALAVLWLAAIYYPNYTVSGRQSVETAFGRVREHASWGNDQGVLNVFDAEERQFVRDALELVPEGSLILNEPNDGSLLAYSTQDANLYYRYFSIDGEESEESALIRTRIDEYVSDATVRDAVASTGARYVLVLGLGGEPSDTRRYGDFYQPQMWTGFNGIADDTPGFEVVLARDDLRLYRLSAL